MTLMMLTGVGVAVATAVIAVASRRLTPEGKSQVVHAMVVAGLAIGIPATLGALWADHPEDFRAPFCGWVIGFSVGQGWSGIRALVARRRAVSLPGGTLLR